MATTPVPPRKKLGVATPVSDDVKRGVRKRGGAPTAYRAPKAGAASPSAGATQSKPRARFGKDDAGAARAPRDGRTSRFPASDERRPPRPRDGETRAPFRDRTAVPAAQKEGARSDFFRDAKARGDARGDARPPRAADGDTRPPRPRGEFTRDRAPRPRDDSTRPPRDGAPPDRAPRARSADDTRPPRPRDEFKRDDARSPRSVGDATRRPAGDAAVARRPRFGSDERRASYGPAKAEPRSARSSATETPIANLGEDDTRPVNDAPPRREFGARERKPFGAKTGEQPRRRNDADARSPASDWKKNPAQRAKSAPQVRSHAVPRKHVLTTEGVQTFFATCPRGLEQVLREELLRLGAAGIEVSPGGVLFKGSFLRGLEANLESRVASRVMWLLAEGDYRNEEDIYALARTIDWPRAFAVEQTIKVQVTAILSPLTSIDFIALKVKDAICDVFRDAVGARPSVDTSMPNQRIHVFLNRNRAAIYLDVSGEALFKRGYRRDGLTAPIRENLAAGILKLLGWTPDIALLDPMCGSGTFITEALLIAMNAAPGLRRRNAHERWLLNPTDEFHAMKDAARARIALPDSLKLIARDTSSEAVQQTRAHVAALGGSTALDFGVCSVLDLVPPEGVTHGMIVANPPYGVRLSTTEELTALYPRFSQVLRDRFAGWDASFITADLEMPKGLQLKPKRQLPLRNGALDCRLFTFAP